MLFHLNLELHRFCLRIDFYDEGFRPLYRNLKEDFQSFVGSANMAPHFILEIRLPSERPPPQFKDKPLFQTRMCQAFGWSKRVCRYPDQHELHLKNKKATLFGAPGDLIYEIAFTFILSRSGEEIETRNRWLRLHALAFELEKEKVLVLSPSGVGKSFLSSQVLSAGGNLLGDEIIWFDGKTFHGFPIRRALFQEDAEALHLPQGRTFHRKLFDQKILFPIPPENTQDRMENPMIFWGRQGGHFRIRPLRWWENVTLFAHLVLGLGLPQMAEFLLRLDHGIGLIETLATRIEKSLLLLSKNEIWRLTLKRKSQTNLNHLLDWLKTPHQEARR